MNEETIRELSRAIGKLEGTVSSGFETLGESIDGIEGTLGFHNKRILTIEQERLKMKGAISMASLGWSLIVNVLFMFKDNIGTFLSSLLRK